MQRTQRVFVLLIAVFFVSAYFFNLQTGLLATVAAIALATLFKAGFGTLARLYGYDRGETKTQLVVLGLTGLAATGILWAYDSPLLAAALLAGPLILAAGAFGVLRR
ncbi:MAG TPA: hypothetical protein PKD45_12490 [Flavobacteriales bacterium]|nr:hypothetical protein [Flavobacteriales bacterium]